MTGVRLDHVVPWGRSGDEYAAMFALTAEDRGKRILGCGDGPASFNAEWRAQGCQVVSCDPLYEHNATAIASRIDATRNAMESQLTDYAGDYNWERFPNPGAVVAHRLAAMEHFLTDYRSRERQGRYVAGDGSHLPFKPQSFDLALVSHFLFTFGHLLGEHFHVVTLEELLRVAGEVRIFPLIQVDGSPAEFLPALRRRLESWGVLWEEIPVEYRFQKGAEHMLRLTRIERVDLG
jgi:hypothetical protein